MIYKCKCLVLIEDWTSWLGGITGIKNIINNYIESEECIRKFYEQRVKVHASLYY
jgi:hypothetical protein